MARIAIYGAGGLGRDLIAPIQRKGLDGFDELVFADQTPGGDLCGIAILSLDDLRAGGRLADRG